MAKATALTKSVPDGVTLTLTNDEAETLRLIVSNIGGDRYASRRKDADAIANALGASGVKKLSSYDIEGVLRFPLVGPLAGSPNPFLTPNPYLTNTSNGFTLR